MNGIRVYNMADISVLIYLILCLEEPVNMRV